ncbi:MAG: DUF3575 domain-containing protein [Bacteroidales bacterium]
MSKKLFRYLITGMLLTGLVIPTMAQQAGTASTAKADKDYKFTIKTNPLNALGGPFWFVVVPITGEYKLLLEAAVTEKISIQLGASYIGPSVLLNLDKLTTDTSNIASIKTSGYKFSGMVKYFLSRDLPAPQGFYIGPHFSYASAKIANKQSPETNYVGAKKLCINAVIGYQMITSGGFTLDVFTGVGYVKRDWNYNGTTSGDFDLGKNRSGINIPLGVSFGYAF